MLASISVMKIKGQKLFLPVIQQETNPVVHRALTQARKVINAIIREYGSPNTIRFVVANDLAKTYKQRKELESTLKRIGPRMKK